MLVLDNVDVLNLFDLTKKSFVMLKIVLRDAFGLVPHFLCIGSLHVQITNDFVLIGKNWL